MPIVIDEPAGCEVVVLELAAVELVVEGLVVELQAARTSVKLSNPTSVDNTCRERRAEDRSPLECELADIWRHPPYAHALFGPPRAPVTWSRNGNFITTVTSSQQIFR
ncbi:MAG TPA: hypothetical protein VK217_03290 [Acidimicrobiales bacterium]|nr:hypothetical protein [Acidimicrobiales bacterium]